MIDYHTNYNHPRVQILKKYMLINQFKDFKKSLITYHLQQLHDEPSIANIRRQCMNFYNDNIFFLFCEYM